MRRDERGPWYLLTGLVIGIIAGLVFAWVIEPVSYTNTKPASLRADFKDQYRALIALAYLANGDLVRAKARLELLEDADMYRTLAEQAQRVLGEGGSPREARALGLLAVALGQAPATVSTHTPTSSRQTLQAGSVTPTASRTLGLEERTTISGTVQVTASTLFTLTPGRAAQATATPTPSLTPLPSRTPTPTQGAAFIVDSQELVCNPDFKEALIQVIVLDAARQQIPGVEVIVNWEGGEEHFYTGLKAELGSGYADFAMIPGVTYNLRLAAGGEPVQGLTAMECEKASGERYWGSWRLVFIQP